MLKTLSIKNGYGHKDVTFKFEKGFTVISGPNEVGKSVIFEMIRYALFGTKALRGAAADYRALEVTLSFDVSSINYIVKRTSRDATLHQGSKLLARSTSAVNGKIIQLIGYGLKTFDNINNIPQNKVEKLTDLSGPERKKFVDELIGTSQIDALVSEYQDEAKVMATIMSTLESQLAKIEAPTKPIGYRDKADIEMDIERLAVEIRETEAIETTMNNLTLQAARIIVLPDPHAELTLEEVNVRIATNDTTTTALKSLRASAPAISRLYDADIVSLQFDVLCRDAATLRRSASVVRPKLTPEQLAEIRGKHVANDAWERLTVLKSQLADLENCPRCGMTFDAERGPVVDMINELEPIARPHRNLPSKESLNEIEEAWKEYNEQLQIRETVVSENILRITGLDIPFTETEFEETISEIKRLEGMLAPSTMYDSRASKMKLLELQKVQGELKQATMGFTYRDLPKQREHMRSLQFIKTAIVQYDAELSYWQAGEARNERLTKEIQAKLAEYESIKQVVAALQAFKYYVNTYFLPSVNKAASSMLRTMTNGVRRSVYVDNTFDITVDGLNVGVLSGSAKALVNVALRLAFQYVLTKNSFSVFMGDEIDASMTDERAKYFTECLNNVTDQLSQLIVISHREITSDHRIKL